MALQSLQDKVILSATSSFCFAFIFLFSQERMGFF